MEQIEPYLLTRLFYFSVVAFFAGLGLFYWGFTKIKLARLIQDTPTSKIRSASQGFVELVGQSQMFNEAQLKSKLGKTDCLWYHYEVEKKRTRYRNGRTETYWDTIDKGESKELFVLKDDTGDCVVDPIQAEIYSAHERIWYGSSPEGIPDEGDQKSMMSSLLTSGQYRYTEKLLIKDDHLYVLGGFKTVNGKITGRVDYDLDRKKLSMKQRFTFENAEPDAVTHMMSNIGLPKRLPYIISNRKQDKLVSKLKLYGYPLMLGGFLVILLGIYCYYFSQSPVYPAPAWVEIILEFLKGD